MSNCKTTTICGRRRTLCFRKDGKIKSNTPVHGGGGRKSSKSKKSHGGAFVSKSECLNKRTGKLKKGFHFVGSRCKRAAA